MFHNVQSALACWCNEKVIVWLCIWRGGNPLTKAHGLSSHTYAQTGVKIEILKGQRCWIFLLDYSNQSWWGMLVSLKWWILSISDCQFISNPSMMNVKSWKKPRTQICWDRNKKLTHVNLQLNWCPSKSTTPVLKRILFQYLKVKFTIMNFLEHTTSWTEYDMQ